MFNELHLVLSLWSNIVSSVFVYHSLSVKLHPLNYVLCTKITCPRPQKVLYFGKLEYTRFKWSLSVLAVALSQSSQHFVSGHLAKYIDMADSLASYHQSNLKGTLLRIIISQVWGQPAATSTRARDSVINNFFEKSSWWATPIGRCVEATKAIRKQIILFWKS